MRFDWKEAIGILATVLVFISLTRSNTKHLRIINFCGSVLFVIYGLLIGALSVWILNGGCAIVNIYKLVKQHREEKSVHFKEVADAGVEYNPVLDARPDVSAFVIKKTKKDFEKSKENA